MGGPLAAAQGFVMDGERCRSGAEARKREEKRRGLSREKKKKVEEMEKDEMEKETEEQRGGLRRKETTRDSPQGKAALPGQTHSSQPQRLTPNFWTLLSW